MTMVDASLGDVPFHLSELFFSVTDSRGFIRSANTVFSTVSGYSPEEWQGAAHNLVRHEDMPRIVFRVLWDGLKAGRPVAAYVKNRTKSGQHYWVFAVAFPVGDELFSVRLKPSSALLPVVRDLYRSLLVCERSIESDGGRSAAMDASEQLLLEHLEQLGFPDYEQFMWRALAAEVTSRTDELGSRVGAIRWPNDPQLRQAHSVCNAGLGQLGGLGGRLETYEQLAREYRDATAAFGELADEVSMFALNARLNANRSGGRSAVLASIANLMRNAAHDVGTEVERLTSLLEVATAHVRQLAFSIARSSLALEMIELFLVEIDDEDASARAHLDARALIASTAQELRAAAALLRGLDGRLTALQLPLRRLLGHLRSLRILRIRAGVDSAGDDAAEQFSIIVEQVEHHLVQGLERLEVLRRHTAEARDATAGVAASQLDRHAAALAAAQLHEPNAHDLPIEAPVDDVVDDEADAFV
jgi:aerotaxis receptor